MVERELLLDSESEMGYNEPGGPRGCGGPINYYMILAILVCISNTLESQPNTIINVSTYTISSSLYGLHAA